MRLYLGRSLFSEWAQNCPKSIPGREVSTMEAALKDRLCPAKAPSEMRGSHGVAAAEPEDAQWGFTTSLSTLHFPHCT